MMATVRHDDASFTVIAGYIPLVVKFDCHCLDSILYLNWPNFQNRQLDCALLSKSSHRFQGFKEMSTCHQLYLVNSLKAIFTIDILQENICIRIDLPVLPSRLLSEFTPRRRILGYAVALTTRWHRRPPILQLSARQCATPLLDLPSVGAFFLIHSGSSNPIRALEKTIHMCD